jgi:hypothetical protein
MSSIFFSRVRKCTESALLCLLSELDEAGEDYNDARWDCRL